MNDGSAVFALSAQLVTGLLKAEPTRLREIADAWSAEVRQDGEDLGADAAWASWSAW